MFKNKAILIIASAMLALPAAAQAQGVTPTAGGKGGTVAGDQIVVRYTSLAGSEANAKSLVNGLRSGDDITLTGVSRVQLPQEAYRQGTPLPSDGKERVYARTEARTETVPCPTSPTPTSPTKPKLGAPLPPPGGTCTASFNYDIYNVFQTQKVTEVFSPKPAAPMGFGNVDIALALTEAKLRPNASPKPGELKSNLLEILGKRASGQGWGDIAKGYGFELKE